MLVHFFVPNNILVFCAHFILSLNLETKQACEMRNTSFLCQILHPPTLLPCPLTISDFELVFHEVTNKFGQWQIAFYRLIFPKYTWVFMRE